MAKQLKDILKGVKASKVEKGSLGKDPGVDYEPKAGDEQKFVAKHATEKHADRVGNDEDVFDAGEVKYDLNFKDEKRHGRKKGDDKKVYEATEKEDTKCNMSEAGTMCEVHGKADCSKAKPLTEKDDVPTPPARPKDLDKTPTPPERPKKKDDETQGGQLAKTGMRTIESVEEEVELDEDMDDQYKADLPNMHKDLKAKKKNTSDMRREYGASWKKLMHHTNQNYDMATRDNAIAMAQKHMKEEFELHEVLTKDQPAAEWIHDFVHSDNPKFEGKSKKKRTEMALAAYYSKQREKKN